MTQEYNNQCLKSFNSVHEKNIFKLLVHSPRKMPSNSSSKTLIFPFCAFGVLVILLYIGFNSSFSASSLSPSRKSLDSSLSSSISSSSNSKRNKILCLGDSNTKLSSSRSNRNKNSFGKQFPEYLGDLLVSRNAASHVKILNRGVPNTACTRVRSKYSIWTKDEFKSAMSSSEGVGDEISQRGHFSWSEIGAVTIAFGTNDSRDKIWANPIEFKNCLIDMITQINRNVVKSSMRRENRISGEDEYKNKQEQQKQHQSGVVQVLLLTPPPIYSGTPADRDSFAVCACLE